MSIQMVSVFRCQQYDTRPGSHGLYGR